MSRILGFIPHEQAHEKGLVEAHKRLKFSAARSSSTPIIVEQVDNDVDAIVRIVRFPGWQQTIADKRKVKQALGIKYKLHYEQDFFDPAYTPYTSQY